MENVRKELAKKIVNECKIKGTSVTKDLASFLVISQLIQYYWNANKIYK